MGERLPTSRVLAGLACLLIVAACGASEPSSSGPPSSGAPSSRPSSSGPAASAMSEPPSSGPAASAETVTIPPSYGHPEILADVSWVSAHLNDPTVRIVDARVSLERALYWTGHIPGAVYADVFVDVCCPSRIMSADSFATSMGKLGIGDDTTVVAYDTDGGLWAARLWWALRYYGHDQVKVLDGGLRQWVSMGKPLETTSPEVKSAVFTPKVEEKWRAMIDEVRQAIDDPDVALLDALPWPSYAGDLVEYARPGHIPTSLSFPFGDTIEGIGQTTLAPDALANMLMRLHLDPGKRVITYCGGGYAGARAAFVLYLMGFDKVGLYDAALAEWASDAANPMETEP
jgi:thiosulfate/3-mercaptopyruvate sulfurtransferase